MSDPEHQALVAAAVAAEREACASVAETTTFAAKPPAWTRTAFGEDGYSGGWCEAMDRIADAIRKRE